MLKKPNTKEHTLYDSTDVKFKNKSMPFDVRAVVTLTGVVVGRGHEDDFWGVGKIPFLNLGTGPIMCSLY